MCGHSVWQKGTGCTTEQEPHARAGVGRACVGKAFGMRRGGRNRAGAPCKSRCGQSMRGNSVWHETGGATEQDPTQQLAAF
eukprot:363481-Chlamydomonas_euryale.AAC.3